MKKILFSLLAGTAAIYCLPQALSSKTSSDISIIVAEDLEAHAEHWWGTWYDVYELNRARIPVNKNGSSTNSTTQSNTSQSTYNVGGSTGGSVNVGLPVEGIPVEIGGNNNLNGNASFQETNHEETTQKDSIATQMNGTLEEDWHQVECRRNDLNGVVEDNCKGQPQHAVGDCNHSDINFPDLNFQANNNN